MWQSPRPHEWESFGGGALRCTRTLGALLADVFVFFAFFVFLVFLWFIFVFKWQFQAWGHIPTIFSTCSALPFFSPNMDPSTPYSLQKCFKNTRQFPNGLYYLYISQKTWISTYLEISEKTCAEKGCKSAGWNTSQIFSVTF